MCTVSFVPKENGYLLAMNRDERRVRGSASPPAIFGINGRQCIYPHETTGGTWVGSNDTGMTLALLNLNIGISRDLQRLSRGTLIPTALENDRAAVVDDWLATSVLSGILPFRLIGFFSAERTIMEWKWDFSRLSHESHPWKMNHWFSSGASDAEAASRRGAVCMEARSWENAGTLEWLRELHRAHLPVAGAFSICAHREDAGTVSYTEVEVSTSTLRMRYVGGPPCITADAVESVLPLRQ